MNQLDIKKYKQRIGYKNRIEATRHCLRQLHRHHVMSIPFEAIDIELGRTIELDIECIWDKVVNKNRGGYCYELNYLFHKMLTVIGFSNYLISARIFDGNQLGPEYDHMAIVVELEELWLVDVGYGDLFREPIQIQPKLKQQDEQKIYEIDKLNFKDYVLIETLKGRSDSKFKYQFTLEPKEVSNFVDQNNWKQSSAESYFVKNRVCTLPIENGRKTIINNTFKITTGEKTEHIPISGLDHFKELLSNEFNIKINV